MAIWLTKDSKVIVQGITGSEATKHTKRMLAYIRDIPATLAANQVVIELARRLRKPNGDWSELKLWRHSGTPTLAQHRYDPEDEAQPFGVKKS